MNERTAALPRQRQDRHAVRDSDLRAALVATVRWEPTSDLEDLVGRCDVGALVDLARVHRVQGLVHDRLTRVGLVIPTATRERLNDLRMRAVHAELRAVATLTRVAELLPVPFLAFKGPVLSALCFDRLGMRAFSDVDVLVRRRDFATALTTLTQGGLTELATNWEGFLDHGIAEVPLAADGTVVDLHWHPVALGTDRRELGLDEQRLFTGVRHVTVGDGRLPTFGVEDTLLHLCVNAGLGGARILLRLVDVDRVVRRHTVEWEVFTERAHEARARGLCSAVLRRSRDLLGTPVDDRVLEGLEPFPGWLRTNEWVDGRRAPGRVGRGIASGLVLGSGRDTRVGTLRAALRTTGRTMLTRAGRPAVTAPGGALNWSRSRGAARDAEARRRYLAWVDAAVLTDDR